MSAPAPGWRGRRVARAVGYHRTVDLLAVLIVILVIVVIWRGPKTIPQIGAMLGRGIRAAREEASRIRSDGPDPGEPESK